jgi:ribose 1,5-bisphosphokinase PhnN
MEFSFIKFGVSYGVPALIVQILDDQISFIINSITEYLPILEDRYPLYKNIFFP